MRSDLNLDVHGEGLVESYIEVSYGKGLVLNSSNKIVDKPLIKV